MVDMGASPNGLGIRVLGCPYLGASISLDLINMLY